MLSRRTLLKTTCSGFGYLAFAALAHEEAARASIAKENPLAPKKAHFTQRAKRVIFLCMEGAPSHVDTFDYKPKLTANDGKPFSGSRFGGGKLLAPPWKFQQHGKSGLWISELYPELAKHADELCLIHGMHTDVPAHPQAFQHLHTGSFQFKRPSLGAWTVYGLGTDNADLPGFVTLSPAPNNGGPTNYGSAFLPAVYQGTPIGGGGFGPRGGQMTVSNIKNPRQSTEAQKRQLDFIQSLNQSALDRDPSNPAIEGAIESFE